MLRELHHVELLPNPALGVRVLRARPDRQLARLLLELRRIAQAERAVDEQRCAEPESLAQENQPRLVARQLFALTEGFLGPLFYVWLGASLDLRQLAARPALVLLGLALGAGAVAVHAAMRLLGQFWSKASQAEVEHAAKDLAADQREDGGLAQLPALSSDAYATGQATYALRIAGGVKASDPAYQRGARYLLRTQHEDGSWQVTSRSFPLQPYKESGFPHGKDQWISAAGTSWAAMALMLGEPETR